MKKTLLLCLIAPFLMGFDSPWGDGKISFSNGVHRYRRHIQIPATLAGIAANQPTPVTASGVACLQFSASLTKYAHFQFELGDDWEGSDVVVEVDWMPDGASMSGTDTIKWDVAYKSASEGESLNGSQTTESVNNDDDNAQYLFIHSPVTLDAADSTNPLVAEDHVFFQVSRDVDVANDFAGTACVTAFEVLYWSRGVPEN